MKDNTETEGKMFLHVIEINEIYLDLSKTSSTISFDDLLFQQL